MSKTYSHSKTCLYSKKDNEYIKEKEYLNGKTLSSIISDFLNIDEKIIGNYNYFYNSKANFIDDMEEKKLEKYFYNKNIINKENNIYKDINDINKKEIKNKGCNDIEMQKFKLKNIVKMIEFTNELKKLNKKFFSENITGKKEIKNKEDKDKSKSKNKNINNKITSIYYPKNKQNNINLIKAKKININTNSTSKKKN